MIRRCSVVAQPVIARQSPTPQMDRNRTMATPSAAIPAAPILPDPDSRGRLAPVIVSLGEHDRQELREHPVKPGTWEI
jgi:hypothetical protein